MWQLEIVQKPQAWLKSFLAVWVLPRSSVHAPPPASLLVGFLQQTDNRAPAGLPVHLTGHDSSHAGPFHTLSAPCLIYMSFIFLVLPTHLTFCVPSSLSMKLSTQCVLAEGIHLSSLVTVTRDSDLTDFIVRWCFCCSELQLAVVST